MRGQFGIGGRHAGVTLIEVVVALSLFIVLSALVAALLGETARGSAAVTARLEVVEARRVTRDLLDHGIRAGGVPAGDGTRLRMRHFVGHAEWCGGGVLTYRGRRRPDPARDSIWVLRADGTQGVEGLVSIGTSSCPSPPTTSGGENLTLPQLGPGIPPAHPVLVRFFEYGRYTVSDALRYGRRGSPAQPLTAPALEAGASGIQVTTGQVRVEVTGAGDSIAVTRQWRVR